MQKHTPLAALSIGLLVAFAGTVASASDDPPKSRTSAKAENTSSAMDMRSARWLAGRNIHGPDGKSVAEVKDLLLDRGTGRIEYVIAKTDTTLGLGGHTIAIPYEQFDWDAGMERFTLASTKEQLQAYPEYNPERWKSMVSKNNLPPKGTNRDPNARPIPNEPTTTPRNPSNPPNPDPNAPTRNPDTAPAPAPANPNSNTPTAPARPGDSYPSNPNSNTPTAPAPSRTDRDDYESWQQAARRGMSDTDPYRGRVDLQKGEMVEGTVTRVERVFDGEYGQDIVVTVQTNDGQERRIVLGPSWYVSGGQLTPTRGDKVIVGSYLITGKDTDRLSIASRYRTGDRELLLRDSEGNPVWSSERFESDNQFYEAPYYRYVQANKLRGSKIDCRGTECGKVNDLIVDRATGYAAYIAIDPNVNFLGVGDAKRLVPWNIATIGLDGSVRIDATKEMVLASPKLPSDISKLNGMNDDVYKVYDVTTPTYKARDRSWDSTYSASGGPKGKSDSWKADGPIVRGMNHDAMKTISGKVVDHRRVAFVDGAIAPASALVISVDGGPEEVVLMGPMNAKSAKACKPGDAVTIDVVRTNVNGKEYWLARSYEVNGTRTTLIDDSNKPMWDEKEAR